MVLQTFFFPQIYPQTSPHLCHLSQPSGCIFDHLSNIWWAVQIKKAPHYAVFSNPVLQISPNNQSFSQYVSWSGPVTYLNYLPLFWDGLEFNSCVHLAAGGTDIWYCGFCFVLLPVQVLIKTMFVALLITPWSCTRWCFPGCCHVVC
jgi:hypothetical protein